MVAPDEEADLSFWSWITDAWRDVTVVVKFSIILARSAVIGSAMAEVTDAAADGGELGRLDGGAEVAGCGGGAAEEDEERLEADTRLSRTSGPRKWLHFLPGRWRLLYCTGRHIGLTLRQPSPRILISDVFLTVSLESGDPVFSLISDIGFRIMPESNWPHDKSGNEGVVSVTTSARIAPGRIYINEQDGKESIATSPRSSRRNLYGKWRKVSKMKELPASLPTVSIAMDDVNISMNCNSALNVNSAQKVLQEIRTQTPPEMFDLSKIVCGTYIDARLMIFRGVNGSALLFIRSNPTTDS